MSQSQRKFSRRRLGAFAAGVPAALATLSLDLRDELGNPPRFRPPFAGEPGYATWYLGQPYGNTVGAYFGRNTTYVQGQGIHFGIDLVAACDTPVLAIGDGTVSSVDGRGGAGPHNVVIQHDGGLFSLYGHLRYRSTFVRAGQKVKAGDVIGVCGDWLDSAGCKRAPHLHLEIRTENMNAATNPIPFIEAPWDDASIGLGLSSPIFELNLADPRRWQSLYDQPDIRFGGPLINNYPQAWPPDPSTPGSWDPAELKAELDKLAISVPGLGGPVGEGAGGFEGSQGTGRLASATSPLSSQRLTDSGCCPLFEWSPDAASIRFLDAAPDGTTGIWTADLSTGSRYVNGQIFGFRSPSERYRVRPGSRPNTAVIIDTAEARFWEFSGGGPYLLFSPDESLVAYSVRDPGNLPAYARTASIYLGALEGGERRLVARLVGGPSAWFPDGQRLLIVGRVRLDDPVEIWIYHIPDSRLESIYSAQFIRRVSLSPNGRFVAFTRSLEHDPALAGPWVLDTVTREQRRIRPEGSYQWHPSSRGLIVIPPRRLGTGNHKIWWADVGGREPELLTPADYPPLRIANFEWELSPNGGRIVYRSAEDLSLWVYDFSSALDAKFAAES